MISSVTGSILSAQLRDARLRHTAIATIVEAVHEAGGSTTAAAAALGVSYQTLGNWRAKFRLLERQIVDAQRAIGWTPPGAAIGSRRVSKKKK
jgi:molybdenum-dependent DNA-binding transcriptional regulator ModE